MERDDGGKQTVGDNARKGAVASDAALVSSVAFLLASVSITRHRT
jgi:hypothetical protein